uniref:Uncharacterized protein n=1 Tax=Daphnia galeata TaxID=27404 RepID=A0A8J2RH67_9CRUS|nr:unnamed protein product [Daphnia galeata]
MEELKSLEEDFERKSSFNCHLPFLFKERIKIQALLVIRRIFTQANLEHPHWLYLESFLDSIQGSASSRSSEVGLSLVLKDFVD